MTTIHREGGLALGSFQTIIRPRMCMPGARGAYVVIELPSKDAAATVLRIYGKLKESDVVRAVDIVQNNATWEGWSRFNG